MSFLLYEAKKQRIGLLFASGKIDVDSGEHFIDNMSLIQSSWRDDFL